MELMPQAFPQSESSRRPVAATPLAQPGRTALFLLLVALMPIRGVLAQEVRDSQRRVPRQGKSSAATTVCDEFIDTNHPKYFVKIYERAEGRRNERSAEENKLVPIFDYDNKEAAAKYVFEAIDAEVDRNSRIVIEFEREWIFKRRECFDAEILITASVKGRNQEVRNIEVPGYSLVGKEAKVASVPIGATTELVAIVTESKRALDESLKSIERFVEECDAGQADCAKAKTSALVKLVDLIQSNKNQYKVIVGRFADPGSRTLIHELGQAAGRDPQVIVQVGADALVSIDSIVALGSVKKCEDTPEDPECQITMATGEKLVDEILTAFEKLGSFVKTVLRDRTTIDRNFIGYLKDTSISVPLNAEVGDQIILRIQNGPNSPQLRELTVGMRVAEFGVVREVSDSFFFIKRLGVSSSDLESAIAGSGMDTGSAGATAVPREVNFEPAPGVTLAWTFRARKEKGQFRRWLTPGFGLNLSFPRFGSNVVSFTPPDPTMPGSTATAQLGESASDIEVGAGLAVTLFDGALQLTYGSNLNASQDREYWGLGFSFLRVAQKIKGDPKASK